MTAAILMAAALLAATNPAPSATPPAPAPAKPKPATTTSKPAAASPKPTKLPSEVAADARGMEDAGAYSRAVETLRGLRRRVPPDADLELALALDEARSGQVDSAATRLWSPLLERALVDSMPVSRRQEYAWKREGLWINGRYDGWTWYVARARAEVAAALGRWTDARDAARLAVGERSLAGKEWLILAVCAGRAGDVEEATRAANKAAFLDPSLPEAHYVAGVLDWRAGRRAAAQDGFRAALAVDSSFREAAFALVRARLPGVTPDSIPARLLGGLRAVSLLTSPVRPKLEEFVETDQSPSVLSRAMLPLPDSLKGRIPPVNVIVSVLVDERGRPALNDFPYCRPGQLPEPVANLIVRSLLQSSFVPAKRSGRPVPVWASLPMQYNP